MGLNAIERERDTGLGVAWGRVTMAAHDAPATPPSIVPLPPLPHPPPPDLQVSPGLPGQLMMNASTLIAKQRPTVMSYSLHAHQSQHSGHPPAKSGFIHLHWHS